MREFLLSDETENSHGLIIATAGIILDRFKKNPVMFYNHDQTTGVIGRWTNIRVADGKLFATPVFDETDQLGKSIKQKVEKGFIKGASIGVDRVEYEPGSNIIKGCELCEASVCDIPSNQNTLQLYRNNKQVSVSAFSKLLVKPNIMNENDFKTLLQALGLPEGSTIREVLAAIEALKDRPEEPAKQLLATFRKKGIVTEQEKKSLELAFADSPKKLAVFLKDKQADFEAQFNEKFDLLLSRNNEKFDFSKLSKIDSGLLKSMAKDYYPVFEQLLLCIRGKRMVMDEIESQPSKNDRTGWTLDDYRKKAPLELRNNPGLYKTLLEQSKNNI